MLKPEAYSGGTTRHCDTCGAPREPFFDSPCEDPVAWLCAACRTVEMEVSRTSLSPEARRELAGLEAFMRAGAPAVEAVSRPVPLRNATGTALARERARAALAGTRD